MARAEADVGVDPLDGSPYRRLVGEWFAHAHEHDVGEAPVHLARLARGADHLLDDLPDGQLTGEAGLTRGAEPATHRAPGLAADADGDAVGVEHQHGLDPAAALQL